MSTSFLPDQIQDIKNYYEEYGYVVVRNVISQSQIATFYKNYETLKTSKNYYFWSQATNRTEKLEINEQGFIEHSILQPIDLIFQQKFRECSLNIVASHEVSKLLTALTDRQKHIIWQTMFFDKSTGTVAHQDHYYLDSDPPGNLVACWFALENIHQEAGPFFVVPKSHKRALIARDPNNTTAGGHKEYVSKIQNLIEEENYTPQPMLLDKGSVLFWHPFLIHGAFPNVNAQYSRKSFTAHYLPDGYGRLNVSTTVRSRASFNPNILVSHKSIFERMKISLRYMRSLVMYSLRSKNELVKMEMRSEQYQKS
ncbi:hypothetical protein NIES4074_06540 [Cylindrospermum sp. NIES-4074]|nr:hypothetical protein NIES4074_06540 [Cylindrospermum sp. NIES-4074]